MKKKKKKKRNNTYSVINAHSDGGTVYRASLEADIALGFVDTLSNFKSVAARPSEVVKEGDVVDWLVLAWVVGGDADALKLRLCAEGVVPHDANRVLDNDAEKNME